MYSSVHDNEDERSEAPESPPMKSHIPRLWIGRKMSDASIDVDSMSSTDESDSDDGQRDVENFDEIQGVIMTLKKEREQLLLIRGELERDRQSWLSGPSTISSTSFQSASTKDTQPSEEKQTTAEVFPPGETVGETSPQKPQVLSDASPVPSDSPRTGTMVSPNPGGSPALSQHQRTQRSSPHLREPRTLQTAVVTSRIETAAANPSHLRAAAEAQPNPQLHPMHRVSSPLQQNRGHLSPRESDQQARYSPRQFYETAPLSAQQASRFYRRPAGGADQSQGSANPPLPRMPIQTPVLSIEDRMQLMSARMHDSPTLFNHNTNALLSPRLPNWGDPSQLHQTSYSRPLGGDMMVQSMSVGGSMSPSRSRSPLQSSYEWEIDPKRLTLFDKVGSGSFGEVTRASWMGIQVAVKRIRVRDPVDPAILKDFRSELDILSKVRHTNCILFMGACSSPPELMIVTEYAKRGSLYELLHNPHEALDWRLRLRIAFEAATGVLYLHTRHVPIVHRDLKSENILLTENFTVKICDFGMARLKLHSTHIETQHANAGTPAWMAPEVLRGELFDEKGDVYSFSVILWEILYRKEPWSDKKPLQILSLVGLMAQRLPLSQPDPQCPQSYISLIRECWNHQPQARPDFTQIVHRLQGMQPAAAPNLGAPHLSPRQYEVEKQWKVV